MAPVGASAVRGLVELAASVGGRVLREGKGAPAGVSIDSRTLSPGDLFVALEGPRFDGHDFVEDALARGAWGALVAEGWAASAAPAAATRGALVAVPDTTRALQEMARARRADLEIPFVAVTGSVGKTTTKEAVARALSARHRVTKTEGNLNNHLGVPLSLLRAPDDATAAVYELAMSAPGEIRFLAELVRPTVGIVTNVAEVHLESMGSLEAVAAAKAELVEALAPEGLALLNADDPRVLAMARHARPARARVRTFGLAAAADLRAEAVRVAEEGTRFRIAGGPPVRIPAWGRHLVYAALAAVGAAEALGVDAARACEALSGFRPAPGRSDFRPLGRVRLLDDSYNASPASVRAAVLALCERPGGGARIVVLGDMLELGERAEALHETLGAWIAAQPVHLLLLYGPLSAAVRRGALRAGRSADSALHFETREAIAEHLRSRLAPGDHLLVKGSRGMGMERVIRLLEEDLPPAIRPPGEGR